MTADNDTTLRYTIESIKSGNGILYRLIYTTHPNWEYVWYVNNAFASLGYFGTKSTDCYYRDPDIKLSHIIDDRKVRKVIRCRFRLRVYHLINRWCLNEFFQHSRYPLYYPNKMVPNKSEFRTRREAIAHIKRYWYKPEIIE